MKHFISIFCVFALLALVGCSDDKNNQPIPDFGTPNNVNNTNNTNNTNNINNATDGGTDMPSTNNNTSEDMGFDTNVANPGFLNGTWAVTVSEGNNATLLGEEVARMQIRHEDGAMEATGQWTSTIFMTGTGTASGELGGTTWIMDALATSMAWRDADSETVTFGISNAAVIDDDTLEGRWSYNKDGTFGDVVITRVE